MFQFRRAPIALALVTLLWVGSDAAAQELLFGVDGAGGGGVPSSLFELSPLTGAVLAGPIGAIGFDHVVAIDFDPTTGALYGVSNGPFIAASTLITINPTTGVGTLVAPISGMTACFDDNVADMSFNSAGVLYVWRPCADELYTVAKATGVATLIGTPLAFPPRSSPRRSDSPSIRPTRFTLKISTSLCQLISCGLSL